MIKESVVQDAMQGTTLALERTIAWSVSGDKFNRELHFALFQTTSFQTEMERLFVLEEVDGYMDHVCKLRPEFTNRTNVLKMTHEQMRYAIRLLILDLKGISPAEFTLYHEICRQIQRFIRWFRQHNLYESELFLAAMSRDIGGEA
jgi:hypothetical protein